MKMIWGIVKNITATELMSNSAIGPNLLDFW